MQQSTPQYRCEACSALTPASGLRRDKWGDPCCPECQSPQITRYRTRMSVVMEAWFLFNVF